MTLLIWACGTAWVLALVLQCVRLAYKYRPGHDRLYRSLTVAVIAAAAAGVLAQAALGLATGSLVHWHAAALGVVIIALLVLAS